MEANDQIEVFKEFIDLHSKSQLYEIIQSGKKSLIISFQDIVSFNHELADELLDDPENTVRSAELAIEQFDLPSEAKGIIVRFTELPETQKMRISDIRSVHLGRFLYIEGIVRQASDVRPQVTSAKFECAGCGNTLSILQIDQKFKEPSRCTCGWRGKFRLLSKELIDVQHLKIEESPESLYGGEQPKRLSVFLKEDLVEPKMERRTTPGAKIRIYGIVKEVPIQLKTGVQSIRYDLVLEANNIEPVQEDYTDIILTQEDEEQIKTLSKNSKVFEKFASSIAPSIYGHERIKEALVLQLFSGVRKEKPDGTTNRGDIHVLLVGDPGCISGDSQVSLLYKGMDEIQNLGERHLQPIKEVVTKIRRDSKDKPYDFATVFQKYDKQPVLKVVTETGKEVICTYNQPFLTKEGWKRADELLFGTKIRVMPKIPNIVKKLVPTNFDRIQAKFGKLKNVLLPQYVDESLAALYGYILGDGNIKNNGYSLTCYVNDEETDLIQPLLSFWKNTFDIEPRYFIDNEEPTIRIIQDKNGMMREIISTQKMHHLEINSKQIAYVLNFLSNKRVPQQIFKSPKKIIAIFLAWLFEADGCDFGNGRGRTAIQLKSTRPELLRDVQLLLLYFGIHSRIGEDNLYIRRANDMALFIKNIGFISDKKRNKLNEVIKIINLRTQRRKLNQRWEKIKNVEPFGIRDVYDFEVPVSHSFIANGILCHNSGKSQLLQFISKAAPKARFVSGKGASGAGMTASVVKDEFLKGWSLEAGALVLANKGLCAVDELDKIDKEDTAALHSAMEQQIIPISKANIQACYSQDTEVLTEIGWKKYSDVTGEKIAQYDPKTKKIIFLKHNGLYVYDYNGIMYYFKDKRNDIFVTPNHRMLVKERRHKNYSVIEAQNINYFNFNFLNASTLESINSKYLVLPAIKHKQNRKHAKYIHQHKDKKIPMNLWLEFLGYYLSEGGIETEPTIGISQKKGKKANKIKKCLVKLSKYVGFKLTEIKDSKYIWFKATNTQLCSFIKQNAPGKDDTKKCILNLSLFSNKQLEILYNAMLLGDGSSDGKSYGSTSLDLINLFQSISCLIGKSASMHVQYEEGYRNRKRMYRVSLSNRNELLFNKSAIKKIDYKGKVFCFATDTGFFITRRNGKVAIQGNTLTCQTTLLAAANPKLGRFDPYTPIASQIDLPSTLINRFDLIFPVRDIPNREKDTRIALHVLQAANTEEVYSAEISVEFLRKYIAYAKQKLKPKLSSGAIDEIKEFYVQLRNSGKADDEGVKPIPISARQLEGLVRLAEASAKLRLDNEVTREDAKRAVDLLRHCLMQVGFDPETGQIDIDRISSGISASTRGKIIAVKEIINDLEGKGLKEIPIEEIIAHAASKGIEEGKVEEAIDQLKKTGDIFEPKRNFISRVS